MSNLSMIQPQRADFDTCQAYDWLDGLPVIGTPGVMGTLAGSSNVGNGGLVASAGSGAAYGAHVATVTAIVGGFTMVSVVDPLGISVIAGVVGAPIFAAGLTLTLSQGSTAFAVGDSFAISVGRVPVDLTGLRFDLDARTSIGDGTVALRASSVDTPASIVNGGASGVIAMQVLRATMAQCPVKLEGYAYSITAQDLVTGLRVPAFYGLIHHAAIAAQIGQAS